MYYLPIYVKIIFLFTFLIVQCYILSFRSYLTKLRDQLKHSFRTLLKSKSITVKRKVTSEWSHLGVGIFWEEFYGPWFIENFGVFVCFFALWNIYCIFFLSYSVKESDFMPFSESFILWNLYSGYITRIVKD